MKTSGYRAALAVLCLALTAAVGQAQVFPILQGDPVDGFGRALPILPGVPLITANGDGDFKPPVVDAGTIGDVDLVVRAGHLTPGATMPPPALVPPTAAAGGSRFAGGIDIPFTVIASDGDPTVPGGHPLLGPELDGIPVVVFAFADLDRDGFIGPTNADPDGAADNARELQEASFPVGVRVAYFAGGVAQGVIASDVGAPASAGGLPIVLTAAAYVGQFSLDFLLGTVPDGPAVSTLQPFFPRLDPDRVIDTNGSAGPALPDGRIAIEFESEFEPPVGDPVLGTPFALPTDGSSVTIDRALVTGGQVSQARFVQPASSAGLTGKEPRLPLHPGAGTVLFTPLSEVSIVNDGPGNGVEVQLVPVDIFGNVTDPATPLTVDLVAQPEAIIASPDLDGDPTHESVVLSSGAGAVVTIDDTDPLSGAGHGLVTASVGGVPVSTVMVHLTPGPPPPPPDIPPTVGFPVVGLPWGFSLECPVEKTLSVPVAHGSSEVVAVSVTLSQNDKVLQTVDLALDPDGPGSGSGVTWSTRLPPPAGAAVGTLELAAIARDANGLVSEPGVGLIPVANVLAPMLQAATFDPPTLTASTRTLLSVAVRLDDDCGVRRVVVKRAGAKKSKRFVRLNDRGRNGDATAGDRTFSGRKRLRVPPAANVEFSIEAENERGVISSLAPLTVPVAP